MGIVKLRTDGDLQEENVSTGSVNFAQVSTYADLLALGTPSVLLFVLVGYDSKVNAPNTSYQLWPTGARQLISTTTDRAPTDYSQAGTVIDDGGGTFQNSTAVNSAKVFDGNAATYYDAANSGANKYVGRDLGTAQTLNRVTILPRQDAQYGPQINTGQLQYSTNGTSWTTIYTVSGVSSSNYTQLMTVNFSPITARYWRLFWPNASSFGNVSEIQLLLIN